jgi:hypothetical protein
VTNAAWFGGFFEKAIIKDGAVANRRAFWTDGMASAKH